MKKLLKIITAVPYIVAFLISRTARPFFKKPETKFEKLVEKIERYGIMLFTLMFYGLVIFIIPLLCTIFMEKILYIDTSPYYHFINTYIFSREQSWIIGVIYFCILGIPLYIIVKIINKGKHPIIDE